MILDVVYNHVGASGVQALEAFGPYFTEKYETPWGRAINYDDADCDPVREWVLQSADGLGRATSASTGCAWTRSTRSSTRAPSTSSRLSPAGCTRSTRGRW